MQEKKEEGKKEEEVEKKKEEKKEEEKKEEEAQEIVLKVDMHCEACARKVTRALKGFEGNLLINFSFISLIIFAYFRKKKLFLLNKKKESQVLIEASVVG